MARALNATLDAVMLGETRKPGFLLEIYDVRSTSTETTPTRINDVVLFNLGLGGGLLEIVGPRDFTSDVEAIDVTENAGDYTGLGIAASQIVVQLVDVDGSLDPVENPAPVDGRWLRQGNVVVLREGDEAVPSADWPITFTGTIRGQPGQNRGRVAGESVITFKAASREVEFLKQQNTSQKFPQSTSFQSMASTIAETDMGLDLDEINFPTLPSRLTVFATTQFADESPLDSIAQILFPDGFMPRFGGDGRLRVSTGSITKAPTRFYPDRSLQLEVTRPILELNGVNEVEVIGLDPDKEQVTQQRQLLARASITTGFFSRESRIDVFWSDDRTQQALDVVFEVDSSVADGIFSFGGESFTNFPNPDDGGSTEGRIDVDGGLEASVILATLVAGAWLASHKIPDNVIVFGAGASEGITIPIGRPVEGAIGKVLFTILGSVGRGQYRVMGRPYEYVFQEIRSVARIDGVLPQDRNELRVENHLISSVADCDAIAETILRRERAKQNQRTVRMIHDLALEPDDIFELGSGLTARRYMIRSVRRTLRRGSDHVATLTCFETTVGVRP